jgi:ubiquinone/menaquinone biosynthesis C-methylase UbiE
LIRHFLRKKLMSSKQFFDDVAGDWDAMRANFYSERVREKAFEVADVRPGQLAADVGAGTGFITEGLIRKGVQVIAIDQSEIMLKAMESKFSNMDEITYRLGEASRLPLPDEPVEHVFANMYLHHVESPAAAIAEMARLLKPEGRLTITDVFEHEFEFLKTEHHDRWLGFRKEDLEEWFRMAGLKNISVRSLEEECRVRSNDGKVQAVMDIFVAAGEKQ